MKPARQIPAGNEESVWDYPRPPRLESCPHRIRVVSSSVTIADTIRAMRVLETSHPPVYYIPPADINADYLQPSAQRSFCEWKGAASYYSVVVGGATSDDAAWYYPQPSAQFAEIRDYVAFYASKVDACYVDDERVQAQAGDFYGGWITSNIVGPFKGAPGTRGW